MVSPAESLVASVVKCVLCGAPFGGCDCGSCPDDGVLIATHAGVLKIEDAELRCYVLSNGQRVFDADDIREFFGGFDGD